MSAHDVDTAAADSDPRLEYEADGVTYTIRRFRPGDEQGFLDVFAAVDTLELGGGHDWFDWKYRDNPYLVHVPIFVGEADGDVVGVRPFFPFRLRAGPRTLVGLQTTDTMVHPDHRGRGLFSQMNDLAFAYYRRREPALLFSIPNARSRPAYLGIGARTVGPVRTAYRIERPSAFVDEKLDGWAPQRGRTVLDGLARGYLRLQARRRGGVDTGEVDVERRATVPSDTFATLAEDAVPETIHAHRDRQFYDWRFDNPHWEYDSYLATDAGEPIAGLITASRRIHDRRVTRLSETVPLTGERRLPGLAAILEKLLRVDTETDVFACAGSAMPTALLRQFGFHPDDTLPLAPLASTTVLITMPLSAKSEGSDSPWRVEGGELTDPDSWVLPFSEQNTG